LACFDALPAVCIENVFAIGLNLLHIAESGIPAPLQLHCSGAR
jgi:hypothetical protein